MVLERASHHEDFPLAWLGEETRDEAYIQGSELPGIPLSEEVLERKIHKGHKVKHLEVTFRSHEGKVTSR